MGRFIKIYTIVYVILIQLIAISIFSGMITKFNNDTPIVDIILSFIFATVMYVILNLGLLIPFITVLVFAALGSFVMAISLPLYLFLTFFEWLGSSYIDLLQYGFLESVLYCTIATPIGIMNLIATYKINQFIENNE